MKTYPMKNIAIVLLLVLSGALGALAVHQQKQSAQTRAELVQVQNQLTQAQHQLTVVADAADQIASAKRSSKALQDSLTETSKFADEKAKQAELLQQQLAAKTNSSNPLAGMARMFSDPKMKEMIKNQQKAVMGPMIDKQYGALFQQLNMTPEESTQLKTLLMNKMLAGADAGMAMLDENVDAAKRAELTKQMKAATDEDDAQIKQFLGDAYPSYQNYEKTVPDRTVVDQFSDQLSGDNSLSSGQQAQLIQALSDARTGFKWTTDYSNKNPPDGDYAAMFSAEKIDQFTQEKEQFDQQFLTQAQKILSPVQLAQFEQYQASQRQMQIMGMKMAAQMFAPK
jgi:hypothetical protein